MSKTKDDIKLTLEAVKANIANNDKEIAMITKAREEVLDKKRLLQEQISLRTELHKLSQENFSIVDPKWGWEGTPEWTVLMKKLSDNEFSFKMYELDKYVAQVDSSLTSFEEQLKSLGDARSSLLKKVAELGGSE